MTEVYRPRCSCSAGDVDGMGVVSWRTQTVLPEALAFRFEIFARPLTALFPTSATFDDLEGKAQRSLHALPDALSGQYKASADHVTTKQNIASWVKEQVAEGKVTTGLPGFQFDIEVEGHRGV